MSIDEVVRLPKTSPSISARTGDFTATVYICGAVGYGLLCFPAIGQRGYPPIDPIWEAMAFLWPAPLLLSALFDTRVWRERRTATLLYCAATAFIAAGTPVVVVPKQVHPLMMLLGALVFFPPILVGALIIEGIAQVAHRVNGRPPLAATLRSWPRLLLAVVLGMATVASPFVYRELAIRSLHARARVAAEEDWLKQTVTLFTSDFVRELGVLALTAEVDRTTGFPLRRHWGRRGYADAYNQRIAELVAERGLPYWSLKAYLPNDEQMIAWLDDPSLSKVSEFPVEVSDSIVLADGAFARWQYSASGPGIAIFTRQGLHTFGESKQAAFIGTVPGKPDLVIIRIESQWVGLFHRNGQQIASLSRNVPIAPSE